MGNSVIVDGLTLTLKETIPESSKAHGDMYLVTDYSPDMKFIYNERSLGIYLKETMNLIQIGRGDLIKIHEFFFDE